MNAGGYVRGMVSTGGAILAFNTFSRPYTGYQAKVMVDAKKDLLTSYAQQSYNGNDLEYTSSGIKSKTIEAAQEYGEAVFLEETDLGIISNMTVRPFGFRLYKKLYGIDPISEAGNIYAAKAEFLLNSEAISTGIELARILG